MRTFVHLTQEERYHIYIMHKKNISLSEIAKDMGRNKSTISRELVRNRDLRGYRFRQAHVKAMQHHIDKPKAIKLNNELKSAITAKWSPEQVSGRLILKGKPSVNHETIETIFS